MFFFFIMSNVHRVVHRVNLNMYTTSRYLYDLYDQEQI
jgi:predicted transcriptional regulator